MYLCAGVHMTEAACRGQRYQIPRVIQEVDSHLLGALGVQRGSLERSVVTPNDRVFFLVPLFEFRDFAPPTCFAVVVVMVVVANFISVCLRHGLTL